MAVQGYHKTSSLQAFINEHALAKNESCYLKARFEDGNKVSVIKESRAARAIKSIFTLGIYAVVQHHDVAKAIHQLTSNEQNSDLEINYPSAVNPVQTEENRTATVAKFRQVIGQSSPFINLRSAVHRAILVSTQQPAEFNPKRQRERRQEFLSIVKQWKTANINPTESRYRKTVAKAILRHSRRAMHPSAYRINQSTKQYALIYTGYLYLRLFSSQNPSRN